MDPAMKFVLSYGWQRQTVTYILVCQNGLCRHGWTVSTTASPAAACPNCGSTALIVESIEPGEVIREYMAGHETKTTQESETPAREFDG